MKRLVFVFLFLLSACQFALPVDTINKKMAAFEISYQETIKFALMLRNEGRLNAEQVMEITHTFDQIDRSRNLIYRALELKNVTLANEQLKSVQGVLTALTSLLKEIENEQCDNCVGTVVFPIKRIYSNPGHAFVSL